MAQDSALVQVWRRYPLTQEVFAVFRLAEFNLQGFETLFTRLEEAYAFHMRHTVPLPVVYPVRQVDLVRQ